MLGDPVKTSGVLSYLAEKPKTAALIGINKPE